MNHNLEKTEFEKINEYLLKENIQLYLASNSPRRKWILEKANFNFEVLPSDFNEEHFLMNLTSIENHGGLWEVKQPNHKEIIHEICSNLAIQKALIVYDDLKHSKQEKFILISADTFVYYNQFFLTKPANEEQAFKMLKFLSGKTHTVLTSHCLVNHEKILIKKDIMSLVTFRKYSDREIELYIKSGEHMDKAGAYAIQGDGAIFVESIVGDYLNIVGLSLNAIFFLLNEMMI